VLLLLLLAFPHLLPLLLLLLLGVHQAGSQPGWAPLPPPTAGHQTLQ
jgi:hypothetical protein